MKYLKQLGIILFITFISEGIRFFVPLPVPAGIYGMAILFLLLLTKVVKLPDVEETADYLIAIMGVMFIPAGVGIMNYFDSLAEIIWAVLLAGTLGTWVVMYASGKATDLLVGKKGEK